MDYELIDADDHYYETEDCFTRYGDDSVLVQIGRRLLVRPVGPGHARLIQWAEVPPAPREPTAFGGATPEPR